MKATRLQTAYARGRICVRVQVDRESAIHSLGQKEHYIPHPPPQFCVSRRNFAHVKWLAVRETCTWPPSLLLLIPDCLVKKLPYMLKFQLIFWDFSLSVQEIEPLLSNVGRCKRSPLIFHFLMPSFLSYCLPLPRNAWVQIRVILPVGWCGWLPNPSLNQPVPFCQTIFEVLTGPALWFGSLCLWPASWCQFPNWGSPVCSSCWLSQDSVWICGAFLLWLITLANLRNCNSSVCKNGLLTPAL